MQNIRFEKSSRELDLGVHPLAARPPDRTSAVAETIAQQREAPRSTLVFSQ